MKALLEPIRLYSRSSVLSEPRLVPKESGLCAWYFKEIPGNTPIDGCVMKDGLTLLYVGISQNLRERVKYHFTGNAEGSTLRKSLGVLLAGEKSDFLLRKVGSDESWLDDWMQQNAFVCWTIHSRPSKAKSDIIKNVPLPLNIKGKGDPFSKRLSERRG